MEETIAQRAFRLLKPIPAKNFITNTYSNEIDSCCVIGHYTRLLSDNPRDYSNENCCDNFQGDLRETAATFGVNIAKVNNEVTLGYAQKTPKERSLKLISDMIAAGL